MQGSIPRLTNRPAPKRDPITAAADQRMFGRRTQPVDAGGDGRLQRWRHPDLGDIRAAGVAAALAFEHAAFGELANDLLGE